MSAPTPTERPSPTLPFWGLVWSSAVVGFVVGFQIPNYLGRVILGAAWLTTYPATLGFGALVGIGSTRMEDDILHRDQPLEQVGGPITLQRLHHSLV